MVVRLDRKKSIIRKRKKKKKTNRYFLQMTDTKVRKKGVTKDNGPFNFKRSTPLTKLSLRTLKSSEIFSEDRGHHHQLRETSQ